MSKDAYSFYKEYNGKPGVDIDGAAGIQCVDGWKIFLRWLGFKNYNEMGYTATGWAEGIWTVPNAQVLKYFDKITDYRDLQNGDWIIWGKNPNCFPKSHVAMFYEGRAFGLNQDSKNWTLKYPDSIKYMIGAFRYKPWNNKWVGKKYLKDGVYVVGQQYIDGYWYYFDEKTKEYVTGFKKITNQNKTVYYNSKGRMLYGQQSIKGKWYCFDKSTGAMFVGVKHLSQSYEPSGEKTVVYKEDGSMIHGQDTYKKVIYLCNKSTGELQASWDGKVLKSWL